MFYAHSENLQGHKHNLKDHLQRTGEVALLFAPPENLENLFSDEK